MSDGSSTLTFLAGLSRGSVFVTVGEEAGGGRFPRLLNLSANCLFFSSASSALRLSSSSFLVRWKRSKKDPSFENTFTGFGFGRAAFELVDGSDVDEDVAVSGEAYPEAGRDIADIVGVVETESRS